MECISLSWLSLKNLWYFWTTSKAISLTLMLLLTNIVLEIEKKIFKKINSTNSKITNNPGKHSEAAHLWQIAKIQNICLYGQGHLLPFLPSHRFSPCTSTGWGLTCWRAALQWGTGGTWWTTSCPQSSNMAQWPRRPVVVWGALGRALPAGQGVPVRHFWSIVPSSGFLGIWQIWSSALLLYTGLVQQYFNYKGFKYFFLRVFWSVFNFIFS